MMQQLQSIMMVNNVNISRSWNSLIPFDKQLNAHQIKLLFLVQKQVYVRLVQFQS